MRKNVKKVIAPLLAATMALSCTVCVSAAEDGLLCFFRSWLFDCERIL